MTTTRALLLVCTLLLVACGGGSSSGGGESQSAGGEEGGDHHASLPPEVNAFHAVLAPAWHSEAGEARRVAACEAAASLVDRARGVTIAETPASANDAATYAEAAAALLRTSEELATDCDADGAGAEAALSTVHDVFHALVEQLGAH